MTDVLSQNDLTVTSQRMALSVLRAHKDDSLPTHDAVLAEDISERCIELVMEVITTKLDELGSEADPDDVFDAHYDALVDGAVFWCRVFDAWARQQATAGLIEELRGALND